MRKPKLKNIAIGKWIVFTLIYGIFLMWVCGTISYYFPEPVYIGAGQYFDLYLGAFIIGGSVFIIIAGILFKKIKKK